MNADHGHDPVLVNEVLQLLAPKPGEVFVDCTAGRGGHAAALAERLGPTGTLVALDVDPDNLAFAQARLKDAAAGGVGMANCRWFHANFGELDDVLAKAGIDGVDGLLADLGVSTNQLTEKKHGLSFSAEGPLDMRLDPRIKLTAAHLVARLSERELADLLFGLAQERFSFKIARKIIQTRQLEPILTTGQLARLVRSVVPSRPGQIDAATRTFQALRMAVNEETQSLESLLDSIPDILRPLGRAAIISFHSGEDRLVKQAARSWAAEGWCEVLTPKPVEPTEAEINRNPRSRSAKLRAVVFSESAEPQESNE